MGYMTVIYGIYLSILGFGAVDIGLILTVSSIANTFFMGGVTFFTDKYGKNKIFSFLGLLACVSSLILAFTDNITIILILSFTGVAVIGASGMVGGGGPFNILQQAMLADNVPSKKRNSIFGISYFLGVTGAAFGALLVGLPSLLVNYFEYDSISAYSYLFILTSLLVVLMTFLVNKVKEKHVKRKITIRRKSNKLITKYSVLQTADGFGTALVVGNILSYWFFVRFNVSPEQIALLFALANILSAFSFLFANRLAKRFGAVNAVLFSHLPSNLLVLLIPFMPSFMWAAIIYLFKSSIDKIDIPLRSAYLMGVVDKEDRVFAAGLSGISRRLPASFGPAVTGYFIQLTSFASPFVISAFLQSVNDIGFYYFFKDVKPPEEK
ncbi:MAG: MFS transporter [Thermoproteota archaeon]